MTFTEIQEAVKGNPALLSEILGGYEADYTKHLTGKGFVVRSKTDEDSFLSNFLKSKKDEIVAPVVKEIHDAYDKDLHELFGEQKGPHEKTYDFMKRMVSKVKEDASKISDPVTKDRIKTLEDQIKKMETDHKSDLDKKENEFFSYKRDSLLDTALDGMNVAIPSHVTKDEDKTGYATRTRNMIKSDFNGLFTAKKDNEGNIVFYKGDQPQTSPQDGKPLSAAALLEQNYNSYFVKQTQQRQGTGSGKKNSEGKPIYSKKEEVIDAIKAEGIEPLSKKYWDEYNKRCLESGITEK